MKTYDSYSKKIGSCVCAWVVSGDFALLAQSAGDSLKSGFEDPPASARPRVWWHWMNGNITEGRHQAGPGMDAPGRASAGFQNFDAALSTPQVVDKRLAYMTPEWKDAFKYATKLADQLGMEEAIAGSPGWSESGGPWVPASRGHEEVCVEQTYVEGGKPFTRRAGASADESREPFRILSIHDAMPAPSGSKAAAAVLCRCGGGGLSSERRVMCRWSRCIRRSQRAAAHRISRCWRMETWQKTTGLPIPRAGRERVDSVRVSGAADDPRDHIRDQGSGRTGRYLAGIGPPEKALEASDDGQNFGW